MWAQHPTMGGCLTTVMPRALGWLQCRHLRAAGSEQNHSLGRARCVHTAPATPGLSQGAALAEAISLNKHVPDLLCANSSNCGTTDEGLRK